ncbi:hypothetical protein [Bacillus cereus]|uniref:hypothetical protein n=1 Tax=Bacillus cereus TaxID=1396 RepID=UPI001C8CF054|nr:hypothetical protein [Bacillus cereus]MBX9158357.1 hypothetical protein [Bacillus cereus]
MARVTKKTIGESVIDMYHNLKFMEYVYREVTHSRLFFHEYEASKGFKFSYWGQKFLGSFEHPSSGYIAGDFDNSHKLADLKERYEVVCKLYEDMKSFFKGAVEGINIDWEMAKERYEYRTGRKVEVSTLK